MESAADDQSHEERTLELIDSGAEVAGALAGGTLGTIAGPPGIALGALGGVAVSRAVKWLGAELHERVLGPRQRARVATALTVAVAQINERVAEGEVPRTDGFFESEPEHTEATELLEGVLLRAGESYQERKVPFLGAMFASVAFRSDVSPAHAHRLLNVASRLSHRQLQLLAYFGSNEGSEELSELQRRRDEVGTWAFRDGLQSELDELGGDLALVGVKQSDGSVVVAQQTYGGTYPSGGVPLWSLALTPEGRLVYELMRLDQMRTEETDEVLSTMQQEPPAPR